MLNRVDFQFVELKKNTGKEETRARELFYALWVCVGLSSHMALQDPDTFNPMQIPDLFMERVEQNGDWSLFCPSEAPGLEDVWGEQFVVCRSPPDIPVKLWPTTPLYRTGIIHKVRAGRSLEAHCQGTEALVRYP